MNIKRWIGLVLFLAGIVFVIMAMHYMGQIGEAQEMINKSETAMSNTWADVAGGAASHEVGKYTPKVKALLYSGIAIGVIGLLMLIFCKSKRK
jgi:uncharacterized protein (UPF0333 family)